MNKVKILPVFLSLLVFSACNSSPAVIEKPSGTTVDIHSVADSVLDIKVSEAQAAYSATMNTDTTTKPEDGTDTHELSISERAIKEAFDTALKTFSEYIGRSDYSFVESYKPDEQSMYFGASSDADNYIINLEPGTGISMCTWEKDATLAYYKFYECDTNKCYEDMDSSLTSTEHLQMCGAYCALSNWSNALESYIAVPGTLTYETYGGLDCLHVILITPDIEDDSDLDVWIRRDNYLPAVVRESNTTGELYTITIDYASNYLSQADRDAIFEAFMLNGG